MTVLLLILAFILILLNGFFVAAEFSLVKVRATQLQEKVDRGNATAKLALEAARNLDEYLSATQLGITLVSLALGWIGEPTVASLLEPLLGRFGLSERLVDGIALAVGFTLVSMLHIVIGELAPKSWAIQRAEGLALFIVRPLHLFYVVFRPAIAGLNWLAALVLRPFGMHQASEAEEAHSEDELRMLVVASGQSGELSETEVQIAGQVLGFADKSVDEVMIPRVEIVTLDLARPFAENVALARSKPFSRYPLIDGDHDEVLGVIHIKELFALVAEGESDLRSICREAIRVPVNKRLDRMLRDFQREHAHMAIVTDEYGGTAGLVTMEDVLEQLVGEIEDEHDPTHAEFERLADREWMADGGSRLEDTNRTIGTDFESDAHETLSGLVFERLGRVPRAGDIVHVDGSELTVVESGARRARRIRVRLL